MMLAGLGHKDFYRLDSGLFFQESAWHSKAGAALYNQRDKDKARRVLKEAGGLKVDHQDRDYFRLDARRKDVQGFEPGPYMHFWNVWLDRR